MRRGQQLPGGGEIRISQCGREIQHPLILGQHVPGAARVDRIGDRAQRRQPAILHSAQRGHPQIGGRPFTRRPAQRILPAGVTVSGSRIHQQQHHIAGVRVEGHRAHGDVAKVDQQRGLRRSEQRGQVVEQTRWGTDVVVLGSLCEPGPLETVDAGAGGGADRAQHRADQRRRRRKPRPDLDVAGDRHRPAGHRVAGAPQRPDRPGRIGCPAGHLPRRGVERDPRRAVGAVAARGDRAGVLGGERDNGAPRQRNRQRETQVVIGVFADQVDPPGCAVADRHGPSSRSRAATLSGITSAMNASIADSAAARYFSLVALRRIDMSST